MPVRLLSFIVPLAVLVVLSPLIAAQSTRNVLVLHTYNANMTANRIWSDSFRETFEADLHNQLFEEYFDKDRLPEGDARLKRRLRERYARKNIDLVIALGRTPLEFVMRHGEELWPRAEKVCALPDVRLLRSGLPPGMSCVVGRLNFGATLELALHLMPDTRHVFYIGGIDPSEEAWRGLAAQDIHPFAGRLDVTYLSDLTLPELLDKLGKLPPYSIVLYPGLFRDGGGRSYLPERVCPLVVSASNSPVYSTVETFVGCGVVGGVVMDAKALAQATAQAGVRALQQGASAGGTILHIAPNNPVIDWRQLGKWNVAESKLPPGAIVRFREPTIWQRYRGFLLAAMALVVLQFGFIVALIIQRKKAARSDAAVTNLSGRLINAGEEERKRIARELHDDIGQRLSLLSLQLDIQQQRGEWLQHCLREPAQQLKTIITDVHNLSHQLHSMKLNVLGLEVALKDLCQQMGSRHDVVIRLVTDIAQPVSEDVALCFYRVAQEALQNSTKHSGATRIDVSLTARGDTLRMLIRDFGAGFDPSVHANGLGLATMRERLRSIEGQLLVNSVPGRGTELMARARLKLPLQDVKARASGQRAA